MERPLRSRWWVNNGAALPACLAGIMLAGCGTPNRQYQSVGPVRVRGSSGELYDESTAPYRLRAIEFDEQGLSWDSAQRLAALATIRNVKGAPLVIVFIHGWHHNADARDEDLRSFNQLLARLKKNSSPVKGPLIGIFIGWRGLSLPKELDWTGIGWAARHASFYSRKHATDKVASMNLTSTLYDLGTTTYSRGGHVIFVGHSFGGRILEKAVAQALIGQSADQEKAKYVRPPADLTLLLNPAAEALTARELKLALRNWEGTTPAIVSLTSTSDSATGLAWPIATNLTSNFDNGYRKIEKQVSERRYVTSTAGHSGILVDRVVEPAPAPQDAVPDDPVAWNLRFASSECIRTTNGWWRITPVDVPVDPHAPFVMNGQDAKGYWVVQVPDKIIHGHGGIFDENAIDFIAGLYKICRPHFDITKTVRLAPVEAPAVQASPSPAPSAVKRYRQ